MNILKNTKNRAILAGILAGICVLGIIMPRAISADADVLKTAVCPTNTASSVDIPASWSTLQSSWLKAGIKVVVTAYSSTPDQTDDTPFITASGKYVEDGIIANNMLPFGTKIKIPALYGDKIFTVEDRMASYKSNYHIDIWMPSRTSALNFGVKTAEIEILEN
jgi:3D (Asp-Asp-Asp) domain-containing protein